MSVVVGQVPVRRLGKTLFVEFVPSRWCSYSCTYCRGNGTADPHLNRSTLSDPAAIVRQVADELAAADGAIDRVAIAADGEPTLDAHLGELIEGLRALGKPVAVLSNGSLLTRDDVRAELGRADFVSLTFDTAREASWQAVNVPHPRLRFDLMLQGIRVFAAGYAGQLATETMLLDGMNTSARDLEATADFISRLDPAVAFLAVPSDVSSAAGRRGPALATMERAAAVFSERLACVECLAIPSESAAAAGQGKGDGTTPSVARCFACYLRRSGSHRLRPLAAAKPAAPGPSLAQGKLPASPEDDSQATGSTGQ
ncbi:MAG: radical SAM protein [Deltaproteobacteria bacterium]|nr:radical SAM protein [Deltaproteobacteria bacterium]